MKICSMLACIVAIAIPTQAVLAQAGHTHGAKAAFGSPGKESRVTRTVEVEASEMSFSPARLEIRLGETVKFVVRNVGKVNHEFVVGDRDAQRAHAQMMEKMPDMKHHNDPNAVTIKPGKTRTLVWKFDRKPASPLEFACHEPGHYGAGMKIDVVLAQ
jgi:uncharacterized cupredoxin-like copper-binding protein